MAVSVQMPALGESVTEGTITRWLKQEGDTVVADEPLLEVSTDKVDTEIPAPASGVLTKIIAREDDIVAVGAELAITRRRRRGTTRGTAATATPRHRRHSHPRHRRRQPHRSPPNPHHLRRPRRRRSGRVGGIRVGDVGADARTRRIGHRGTVTRWLRRSATRWRPTGLSECVHRQGRH